MSCTIRSTVYNKIFKCLPYINDATKSDIMLQLSLRNNKTTGTYSFILPLKTKQYDIKNDAKNISMSKDDDLVDNVTINDKIVSFDISRENYIKKVLEDNCDSVKPPQFTNGIQNIVIEYSSPNIAKPFHFGHLRSTMIGNCIANVHKYLQNKVKRINYLGDWGTQYGLLQVGLEVTKITEEELQRHPIKVLYNAYVSANKAAEVDPALYEKAKDVFKDLEMGDTKLQKSWEKFRKYTIDELSKTYTRLNVTFDEYHWESTYNATNLQGLIRLLEESELLVMDKDNRKVIRLDTEKTVPILKSDGSSLYISRDIAAAMDRYEKDPFDHMYYVVDNGQNNHFTNLFSILKRMELPLADKITHVKFGRVQGMSTRKGTAVFLEDILDEARDKMKQIQIESPTTKVSMNVDDNSADILGVSAVIVNDLKRRRQGNYTFDWNAALDMKGDTGVTLQYSHCRLASLIEKSGGTLVRKCNPAILKEEEVDELITLLGKFDEAVLRSYKELEPCILVVYLLRLSHGINKAVQKLKVKDEAPEVGNQRFLLFYVSKNILAQGMRLAGLTPLNKM